ncbi:activator-dependent family glycosyltransferase [Nocardiopsis sp. MG754419]|uniref:activator-dependent family glycosyltransferase n=1 Tax=Nocardiopsis sp. MG754419 TaxID=2259865 RepID=UPI001BAA309D|nr:activator-dependent family glycosyltransferase [Nocardiopsis sp. MG754419]MBR8741841.1 glycosyl transferase [Nocardiopsis sp. MG754419]
MRVLFVTYPENSNVKLITPLAWAFIAAGHEVQVAGHPESAEFVRAAGLTAVPVGRDHVLWDYYNRRPHLMEARQRSDGPQLYLKGDAPDEELTWDYLKGHYDSMVGFEFRLINDPILHRLVEHCERWRPDLVLWESSSIAGAIAAEACGAAHGRLTWAMDFKGRFRRRYLELLAHKPAEDRPDALGAWVAQRAARFGVDFHEDLVTGSFTVDQLPEHFRYDLDIERVPMRFVPFNGAADVPEWLRHPPERPRVCVTLGASVRERLGVDLVDVPGLVEALGDIDAEIVATFHGDERRGAITRVPDNVRLVDFVPFSSLLPTCSAVVHHGGMGTFCTAMAAGVPQVVHPEIYDTLARAARLEAAGAGVSVEPQEELVNGVRDAVRRVLEDPAYAKGADQLRRDVTEMPAPSEVVRELERRVRERVG